MSFADIGIIEGEETHKNCACCMQAFLQLTDNPQQFAVCIYCFEHCPDDIRHCTRYGN